MKFLTSLETIGKSMENTWRRFPFVATGKKQGGPFERKASSAQSILALQENRHAVWTPRDYLTLAREGYEKNAIAYRCVRLIAEAAASVPVKLKIDGQEMDDHPVLGILKAPNQQQSWPDLMEDWFGFLMVAGNAYGEMVVQGGEPREIFVLRPDRMKVVPGDDGWPAGYEYTAGGQSIRFSQSGAADILHLRLFNPSNDHYGLAPMEAAAFSIDMHNQASQWNKALLDNSARPSGALIYKNEGEYLTSEQHERLRHELEAGFSGSVNAGRPLLLEGGLDWKPMGYSPKDLDFLESRNNAAREIALAFGVPPMLLGIPGDNTFANYAEANRSLWRNTVVPLVTRSSAAFSSWFATHYHEKGLVIMPDFDQVEAMSADREQRWKRLEGCSFLTMNEKRKIAGYAPVETGDRF